MSNDKTQVPKRRYREYEWVSLIAPIKCPKRNTSQSDFPGKDFLFFVEDGMFCIEVRADRGAGLVTEVPPAQLREARRGSQAAP